MRRRRAFSLVELVFVIAILSVTAAVALPHWASAIRNQQLNAAITRVKADLTLAQARSNYTSTSLTVCFSPSGPTYQIPGLSDPDRPSATYTVDLAAAPYGLTSLSANFGGSTNLVFDGYGTPTAGGTIVLTLGDTSRTLTIDGTSGRVFGP